MDEIIVNDTVILPNSNDKQTETNDSFFVSPDLQNLLTVFVRQSKENEEISVEISEINSEQSITLYSDKTEGERPSAQPEPEQIVKVMMPLDFGTETPGDDLLSTLVNESVKDSKTIPPALDREKSAVISPGRHPRWVRDNYPEIYSEWETVSGAPVFQGMVRMFCSRCRENPSRGFHEGVPICESCRLDQACTVCRRRVSSTFSYGLALCEADRQFLFRTFSQQPQLTKCESLCPVRPSQWCGYCRFRTCLTTKGFRFFVQASTQHLVSTEVAPERKRKYSSEGVYRQLNFVSDDVPVDSLDVHAAKKPNDDGKAGKDDSLFVKPPPSVIVRPTSRSAKNSRSNSRLPGDPTQAGPSFKSPPSSSSPKKSVAYYDGSRLGLSSKKKTPGLLNDPNRVSWVLQQQEKYLSHHMELFYKRRNKGKK